MMDKDPQLEALKRKRQGLTIVLNPGEMEMEGKEGEEEDMIPTKVEHPLIQELWNRIDRYDIVGLTKFLNEHRETIQKLFYDSTTQPNYTDRNTQRTR